MSETETYQVYAVKYGAMEKRARGDNFIITDDHAASMPLDYFVWAIVNENRTIVVDTGFDRAEAQRRGRRIDRLPAEGLAMLGIEASKVSDVIVTHLHYDHAGTLDDFPAATFHLQESEMRYVSGRFMCHETFRHAYSADHVCAMIRRLFEGRVHFREREDQIAPGVTVHHIGGHTLGIQSVRVNTARGAVVLASDASHFYENMERPSPFPIVYHLGEMLEGFGKLRGLAESPQHVIPGHDPLVMARYPAPNAAMEGVVARLDVAPKG